ncbi:hypothetical protein [Chryseobacterium caseinilyticum]|uniref:Uncharacterized protein n=1 Tax=Chryseobacterium caseinilyticum TaxID=2771428 RepID=A0ABR8ZEY7_9FLAO|nr:hypothetical protein [Chryseobacterium caseinilyticum]MBD8083859.1 hypothetical protein [Chryseobacterium caseinilyticum]
MITLEEYLKALTTIKEYKKQKEADAENLKKSLDLKLLSDFEIPLRLRRKFGEMYL